MPLERSLRRYTDSFNCAMPIRLSCQKVLGSTGRRARQWKIYTENTPFTPWALFPRIVNVETRTNRCPFFQCRVTVPKEDWTPNRKTNIYISSIFSVRKETVITARRRKDLKKNKCQIFGTGWQWPWKWYPISPWLKGRKWFTERRESNASDHTNVAEQ